MLQGSHQSLPATVRPQRLLITPNILLMLHRRWSSQSQDYDTICFWAACSLSFFGFLRSGEFTCQSWRACHPAMLLVSDVSIDSRSAPSIVFVTIRHNKTDVFGSGVTIHLGHTGTPVCPVSLLLAYLARRLPRPGPLFLLQSGNPLSRTTLVATVCRTLSSAGLDTSCLNGHSFRIGAATTAAQAGLLDQ